MKIPSRAAPPRLSLPAARHWLWPCVKPRFHLVSVSFAPKSPAMTDDGKNSLSPWPSCHNASCAGKPAPTGSVNQPVPQNRLAPPRRSPRLESWLDIYSPLRSYLVSSYLGLAQSNAGDAGSAAQISCFSICTLQSVSNQLRRTHPNHLPTSKSGFELENRRAVQALRSGIAH